MPDQTPTAHKRTRDTFGGLLAIVLWSATFALARSLSEQVGSLTAGAAVYLFGGALCLLRLWRSPGSVRQLRAVSRRYLWGCGILFVLYTALVYLAVGLAKGRQQLLEIALVNYLWPAATVLLSIPLLQQRPHWLLLPGTALTLAGVFLSMTQGAQVSWRSFREILETNPIAYLLVLTAAIAWALYSILARRWSGPDGGGAVDLFLPVTGIVLLAMRFVLPDPGSWNLWAVLETGVLGAITTLAYALWDGAMRRGDLLLVASCSYFTPLLSTLVSCAYLRVRPSSELWVGCALIVAGSWIAWRSKSSTRPGQA
jgi:drug/metabolite transporter (DMT)-like permease